MKDGGSVLILLQAVRNMAQALRKGTGKVLFRDYAENDLAHGRLGDVGKQQKLGENFYVRGDGTRCFYFSEVRSCSTLGVGFRV